MLVAELRTHAEEFAESQGRRRTQSPVLCETSWVRGKLSVEGEDVDVP